MVIVGNTPWPRIDVKATVELAPLRRAAEFGVFVSAANSPGTPTCAVVVFQNLDGVAAFLNSYAATRPAIPAPRISILVPLGAPSSSIRPLYADDAANPSVFIAWYMAAPPAALPTKASNWRRLNSS